MNNLSCTVSNSSPVWGTSDVVRWKLPASMGGGNTYLYKFKDSWVRHNKEHIKKWARTYKFPPLLLAGVCWIEVAGDPQFIDGVAHAVRSFDWSGPDFVDKYLTVTKRPEKTSFGPISMQLRVAAETMGADINTLSFADRIKLGRCLEVDVFNIQISAKHLRDLIDHDGLQKSYPELSDENLVVAATRYNRGTRETLSVIKSRSHYGRAIIKRKQHLLELLK